MEYGLEHGVVTRRITDEKPPLAELIVDGEPVPTPSEVDPRLGNAVRHKVCYFNTAKPSKVRTEGVSGSRLRKASEMARAVLHAGVKDVRHHVHASVPKSRNSVVF
jgi:hypothetical protein